MFVNNIRNQCISILYQIHEIKIFNKGTNISTRYNLLIGVLKTSLKILDNRTMDFNGMKVDYVCDETKAFEIRFYSLYLVYYVNNIV